MVAITLVSVKRRRGLMGRLDYIRRKKAGGIKWEPFALSCGLSSGYFAQLKRRCRLDPDAGMSGESAVAVAHTYNMPLDWLVSGRGQPEPGAVLDELDEALQSEDWPPEVVACARARQKNGMGPHTREQWTAWLRKVRLTCESEPPSAIIERKRA